jgi:choline dehydrogenase-like flavoprotein
MFIDFRDHPRDEQIETDICVIGAGAAGLALTQALANSPLDVCLLETGGMSHETAYTQLAKAKRSQGDYFTNACRARQFGGSTSHWGGYSIPLDKVDFERRAWVAHSGWPISRADLAPWYVPANKLVGAGAFEYTKAQMAAALWPYPDLDLKFFEDTYFRRSLDPIGYSLPFKEKFEDAPNVRVFLHATVTLLHADSSVHATEYAVVKDLGGNTARVKARYFVVAAGALESARLLLASNDVQPAGLGNQTDQVGRYFMMHPHVDIGRVVDMDKQLLKLFDSYRHGGVDVIAAIRPNPATQREQRILNASLRFEALPDYQSGYYAIGQLQPEIIKRYYAWRLGIDYELRDDFGELVWMALSDLDSIVAGLWAKRQDPGFQGNILRTEANLFVQSEQAPNPASRVTLEERRDDLGVPMMVPEARILPIDKQTLVAIGELLGRDLAMLGAGRVQLNEWLLDSSIEWDNAMWGGCHHMGTTRMTASDADGVVDKNCKLHTVDNTFIAGGSVFTTSGFANPTLSIVALALRLADHLKSLR